MSGCPLPAGEQESGAPQVSANANGNNDNQAQRNRQLSQRGRNGPNRHVNPQPQAVGGSPIAPPPPPPMVAMPGMPVNLPPPVYTAHTHHHQHHLHFRPPHQHMSVRVAGQRVVAPLPHNRHHAAHSAPTIQVGGVPLPMAPPLVPLVPFPGMVLPGGLPPTLPPFPVVQAGMPPPPPPAQADQAAAPAAKAPAPSPSIKPDDMLIKQFLGRYAHQTEHENISSSAVVGLLDVDECLRVIAANDVTFVVTDTGTGKSSLVPNALINDENIRVANSQPRRTAAINLANRVASLRNEKVGENVGYWVRGERCGDAEKCRLMYMTSYTLLLHIIGNPNDIKFTHVIIDEFHERQPDVEVMLGLLKLALTTKKLNIKIILMSASVELELWKKYFDDLQVGEYSTCQPRYSIHDYYQEEVCRIVGAAPTVGKLDPVGHVSSLELKNNEFLVKEMLKFLAQHAEPKDSILVFLPGRTVVEDMAQWVSTHLGSQLDPIPWYRDMELGKIQANLTRAATTKKKVYLATDIAEVSLTLSDVVFVVDAGFTKKPRIDPAKRNSVVFPPLELLWTSRSSNRQRRGRVGRVQQGFFFCMIPESYLVDLQEMEPQIANTTIHELALHTLQVCNNPIGSFNLCRVGPKDISLEHSMTVLLDGGYALKSSHPLAPLEGIEADDCVAWREMIMQCPANKALHGESYVTTLKGRIAQRLPLNIESSSMVYLGLVFGVESLMILAASIAACGTPFYSVSDEPGSQKRQAIQQTKAVMQTYSHGLGSDIIAALGLTIDYKKQQLLGLSEEGESSWCADKCVMRSRLGDIIRLEAQIKQQLSEQLSFVDIVDPAELETQLENHASIVSLLAAASQLERALFVQNDQRKAQREKRVGPSIFLGLEALCDFFVASVCPWDINHVVIPLSIQTRYEKLLGTFATQLSTKVFNVITLLLAPKVVFELRQTEVLFGVEMYGTKLRMRADIRSGNEILLVRKAICTKMALLRYQLLNKVSPTDPSLDEVLSKSAVKFPPSVTKSPAVAPFLRYCTDSMIRAVSEDATRDVAPTSDSEFRPTKWSALVSCGDGIFDYVASTVSPTQAAPSVSPAVGAGAFVEDDDDE